MVKIVELPQQDYAHEEKRSKSGRLKEGASFGGVFISPQNLQSQQGLNQRLQPNF